MSGIVLAQLPAANDVIAAAVEAELRVILAMIDFTNPVAAREALFAALPALIAKWGDIAATAAAEWFELFRASEGVSGGFRAELASAVPLEQINGRIGYATRESGHLFAGEIDELGKFLSLMTNEYALQPGHDTVMYNAERDKVAFARVPEPGACKFCLMLASRGFVYSRATVDQTAEGERFHGNCRCHAMPVYDETRARVEYGYDPERFYDEYLAAN